MSRNKSKRIVLDDPIKTVVKPIRFKVATLVESKSYSKYADILNTLFDPNQELSYEEADQAINAYLERRV